MQLNSVWRQAQTFFDRLEVTQTVRSYKIVLLLAMLEGDAVQPKLPIEQLTERVAILVRRMHRLNEDFSIDVSDANALKGMLVRNPIDAFVRGDGMGAVSYFSFDGSTFAFNLEIADLEAFGRLLREILDWRLGQYLSRGDTDWTGDVICRVALNTSSSPILFLPSPAAGGSVPQGPLAIEVDGKVMEAVVAKIAINVIRTPGETSNKLSDVLHSWFGEAAGQPGRGDRVRLRRDGIRTIMEPIRGATNQVTVRNAWNRYLRESIPAMFGLPFNRAIWNAGFVVSDQHIFLLVNLDNEGANPNHRYENRFTSDREFSWQSQNRTTQESKHGQIIRNHKANGLHVHLFVRPGRRGQFIYCGEVEFESWEGNAPITVRWRLTEPVPATLRSTLQVPPSLDAGWA